MKTRKNIAAKIIYSSLSLTWGMSLALLVVNLIMYIVSLFTSFPFPSIYQFTVNVSSSKDDILFKAANQFFVGSKSYSFLIMNASRGIMFLADSCNFIVLAALAYFIFLTRKIIITVINGNPFTKENGNRIKILSGLLIVVPVILDIISRIVASSIIQNVKSANSTMNAEGIGMVRDVLIFVGLFLFVLSEVFRIGTSLKEENELTV